MKNLPKDKLIKEPITVDDISSKLINLRTLFSELAVTKNWIKLLLERVIQLETNVATNAHHHWHESVKVNPKLITDEKQQLKIWKILSLNDDEVEPNELQACHYSKREETVIIKFQIHYW